MKTSLLFVVVLLNFLCGAQVNYPKQNIELLSLSTPNFGVGGIDNRLYSGCWGWYQQSKNKEYAICGASNGTYFMDITNPATPTVCAYVLGKLGSTYREMKTYQNYCYIVSDDAPPNKFQIVDMQYLPDSVHIVHEGTTYFERAHTIWIDQDKMYLGSVQYTAGFSSMNVYSLATPTAPLLLRELDDDVPPPLINLVHDMYVRNDTVYASCGYEGLHFLKYNSVTNKFAQLGSYTGYGTVGSFNHSSTLSQNGKYLLFCDEVPGTLPMRFVNVENFGNVQPIQAFKPSPLTTPHNPYMIGNDFAVVACYQDGINIYDLSIPGSASISGFFDTHPQGGANVNNYFGADYRGTWGAYPWLPSKIIIAQDMQNGVFLLDATAAYSNRAGISNSSLLTGEVLIYPNPASENISVKFESAEPFVIQIENVLGKVVYQKNYPATINETINVTDLAGGTYVITIKNSRQLINKKIVIYK